MIHSFLNRFTKNQATIYTLLLFSFFFIAYILPLGERALFVPDETRYAEIPREMIASGDWGVPHLNGLRYFEKPPLGYWMNAASIVLFGENVFAVRLPSALAAGLTALMVFVLVGRVLRRHSGTQEDASILAALIFLSCFEVFGVGNTAVLDTLFSFFLAATIATFFLATEEPPGSWSERGFLLLAGLWCGHSFLTKGFLAFAIPALVLAPYLVWERRFRDLIRMSWLPLLAAVFLALPWAVFVHLREPDFWRFFFWNEHVRRFLSDSAQHKESFWYFFMAAPGAFMPWTFLIPAALPGIGKRLNEAGPRGRLARFSVCWLSLPFLFFSVSSGKLLTYILPCFPPFAILLAFGLLHALGGNGRSRIFHWGVMGNALLFSFILIALVGVQVFGYGGFHPYKHPWKMVMAVNALAFFIVFCLWALGEGGRMKKLVRIGLAPLLLFFMVNFIVPESAGESKAPGPFLEKYASRVSCDDVVISDESTIGAVCWYLNRSDVYVLGNTGELEYGLKYEDASGRRLTQRSLADLVKENPGKTVVFTRNRKQPEWEDGLPHPVFQDDSGPSGYVFSQY